MSITSGKKALVLAISSVLAGWVGSNGSYADDPKDDWPPKKAVSITTGEVKSVPAGETITIKDTCDQGGPTPCNISMTGGKLTIPSDAKIKVDETGSKTSIIVGEAGKSSLNIITNNGNVSVVEGATGVRVKGGDLTIDGGGTIADPGVTNTIGVAIEGGTLKNSSTIKGSKAAIEITGAAQPTATFNQGSIVTGTHASAPLAIDASGATEKVTVTINDGLFTGDIKGNTGKGNELNITTTTGDGIKNNISGFEAIKIKGTDWTAQGWASGITSLSTDKEISDLYVYSAQQPGVGTANAKNTLRVVPTDTLAVTTNGDDSAITNLHISGTPKLNAASPITVENIEVKSPGKITGDSPADGWTLTGWATGVKSLNTSAVIPSLYVNNAAPAQNGDGVSQPPDDATLGVVSAADGLAVTTKINSQTGSITNLNISGTPKLVLGTITANAPVINGISVNSTGWTANGWASKVGTLETSSTIENLVVNNVVPSSANGVASDTANTLRVLPGTNGLEVKTKSGGLVKKLNISGTPTLTAKDSIAVEEITVNNPGWTLSGWATGVKSLTTSATITNLYIDSALPTSPLKPIVQPDTLHVVAANPSLAVATNRVKAKGAITNLNILGGITLTAAAPITVENIVVNSASSLALDNWATGVKSMTTSSAITSLHVNNVASFVPTLKNATANALNVVSPTLAVTTNTSAGEDTAGAITELHLSGTPTLTAAAPINVGSIVVNPESSLALNNWATGVTALTTSSPIKNLYVNNAELSDLPKAEGSALNVNSETLAVTTTSSTEKGEIENLNISSNPQLSGTDAITVKNITVNSSCSESECWKLDAPLNGVKSVNAKNPTPAPAITEPVIKAITLTGSSAVAPKTNGSLNIKSTTESKNPIKITATEPGLITAVNIGSNAFVDSITNAETININGSGWKFEKLVTNPETISVVEAGGRVGAINSAFSGTTVGSPKETLNVAFNEQADVNGYLNIGGTGTISKIDFSNVANRPSLMYTPSGAISVENIKGNPIKADTLVLTDNSYLPEGKLPAGFKGIEYAAPPTTSITPNLKRLGLAGIANDTTITTILKADAVVSPSDVNSDENKGSTKSIPFTASGMPSAFYLKTGGGAGTYTIDFSSSDRPTTTFEIAGGTEVKSLKNVAALNDQLIITEGTLPKDDISSMSALSINGSNWNAPGTFSNLNSLDVTEKGTLAALNVSGKPLTPPSGSRLNVLTTSDQQMPVTIAGTLSELHANDGASLGAIDVGGTLNELNANKGASLGAIDVGGKLSVLNANPGSSFGAINVASGGELPALNATESSLGAITVADDGTLSTLNANKGTSLGAISVAHGGTLSTLNATESSLGAITVADGGILTTLTANKGTNLKDIVGAKTVTIAEGASLGAITDASTVNINGVATTLGPITNTGTVNASSLAFQQVKVGSGLPAGAKTGSTNGQDLILYTPTKDVALTTKGIGTLTLGSGAKLGATKGGVNNLKITGNDWTTKAVTMVGDKDGKASIDIMEGVSVGDIGKTGQVAVKKADAVASPSSLPITFNPTKSEILKVTSSGNIKGNIDFTDVPKNATVTLEQTGGMIEGDITGVSKIMISGIDELNGSIKGEVSLLDIVKGGKLKIHKAVNIVGGSYHQVGDLEMDANEDPLHPLVDADSIDIEPDARLVAELKEVNDKENDLLMISKKPINRAVTLDVKNEQYEHFTAMLDSKDNKRMVVAREPMVNHVRKLATAGGAPASAVRALEVAANKKVAVSDSDDNLNKFVVPLAKTSDQAAQLARQLTPDNTASAVSAAQGAQRMSGKAIETRTASIRTGISSGDMMESGGFWIQYAYNDATQDEHDGVYGFDAKTNGFTLGMDTALDDMTDVGLAYTYAKTDISGKGSGSSMDSKNHIFSLYGAFTQDEMFLDGQLSYSSGDNDAQRSVGGNSVKANYDSKSWGISLTAGYTMPMDDDWSWQPLGAFNYYRIETDDYSESAAVNYLAYDNVRNDNYSILELGVGVKLVGDIHMDDMVFQPAFKLMAFHDFKDDPVTMTAHYAAGGESFVVHGAKRDDTRFQFAASVDMELQNNMTLSFNYSHDWMDNFKSDGFIARLRYEF
ncbi:autotransporter domain-containing protein [Endozoicomonas sp. YOMI1]|uniref:autotransporter domain-containing protein n=1 Tax=Endozoicomonas sp. YOMI1 TaxID=2828739 RepID=UPI002148CAFB|nr:autotransporter domain-containing protein [Endozoicomonas sp. YOMI1]